MRRFINLEMTGEKKNCDEILKNDKIFENKNIVESDQELRKALLISVFLSLSINDFPTNFCALEHALILQI